MSDRALLPHIPVRRRRRHFLETEHEYEDFRDPKRVGEDEFGAVMGCARCVAMFSVDGLEALNNPLGFRHSTHFECLASVNRGCPLCFFIITTIQRSHDERGQGEMWYGDTPLFFRNRSSSAKPASAPPPDFIDVLDGYAASENPIISIYPYAKKDDPMSKLVRRRPLQRDVKSERVLKAARDRYDTCKDSHSACQYARDSVLPSRVLDVGTVGEPSLKLFVNETEKRAEYLALSYCWGEDTPENRPSCLLLRATLSEMSGDEGIVGTARLQRSVRDAVTVARMLGFRYLWVDALCIIQDCVLDQGREIERMATIYKNAAATIAAGTAARASDGFLDAGGAAYLPDEKVVVPTASPGTMGTVHLRSGAHVPRHALDDRGWVLQEFLLSSRLLIFSEYELLWQCKEDDLRSVTGGTTGASLDYLQPLESLPWTGFSEDSAGAFGNDEAEKKYLWRTVVEQYTLRRLSKSDDRMNALRGITRELELLWQDRNYYGLWERWFVELLGWYKPKGNDEQEKEKRRSRRAPSWSWASLERMVMYTEPLTRDDAEVKGWDLVGTRSARHVVLQCRILRDEDICPDDLEEDDDSESFSGLEGKVIEFPDLKDPRVEMKDKDTEYLLLGVSKRGRVEFGVGLMIIDAGGGFYQRVGLAEFQDMSIWEKATHREIKLK